MKAKDVIRIGNSEGFTRSEALTVSDTDYIFRFHSFISNS